ncbi:hypothetical protein [Rhizobium sp. SSA_523]|uniref:hypothetical protein n=1 Tax=Rhizobium sp. SSA_523 TaxID=2952477 RepID=UPI002091D5AC|nr:hypothetical protein [Rhizobium sp. SSA_523]MCO5730097.1 hypothetical protein [Rhizobium sp. SSA_523]WKC25162.1 hypothetical protein QTJ18_14335 [Rhizobium sp. SSA_523]
MDDRFRDKDGRIVPVHIVLASLQDGLLREVTAALAMAAFIAAITVGCQLLAPVRLPI